jgi:hypothetical protein
MTTGNVVSIQQMGNRLCQTNQPTRKRTGARYIITAIEYLTRWAKATLVKDYSIETTTHFLFEQVITRFGCPRILMSDQGTHFINNTTKAMTE